MYIGCVCFVRFWYVGCFAWFDWCFFLVILVAIFYFILFFLVGVSFVVVRDCFFVSRFVFLFVCLTKTVVYLSGVWVSVNFLLLAVQYNT